MDRKDFFKVLGGASMVAALGGCSGFLDVAPTERPTLKSAFQNKDSALNSLYSCYGYVPDLRDIGSISKITADEVLTPFTQKPVQHFPRGTYSPSNPVFPFGIIIIKESGIVIFCSTEWGAPRSCRLQELKITKRKQNF